VVSGATYSDIISSQEETMNNTVASHAAFGCARALLATQPVKYLVIQISDPTRPQIVPE
jgi:hypothetical protein